MRHDACCRAARIAPFSAELAGHLRKRIPHKLDERLPILCVILRGNDFRHHHHKRVDKIDGRHAAVMLAEGISARSTWRPRRAFASHERDRRRRRQQHSHGWGKWRRARSGRHAPRRAFASHDRDRRRRRQQRSGRYAPRSTWRQRDRPLYRRRPFASRTERQRRPLPWLDPDADKDEASGAASCRLSSTSYRRGRSACAGQLIVA